MTQKQAATLAVLSTVPAAPLSASPASWSSYLGTRWQRADQPSSAGPETGPATKKVVGCRLCCGMILSHLASDSTASETCRPGKERKKMGRKDATGYSSQRQDIQDTAIL
ncbi:hypothetical protein B0T09DRAFT_333769 [Sordaria sp. MPI-SDFR-AT-0083]|nr:hypothetical protein B0T09DRAFT_333769 [Sordaria sp. MPI-SDFR-AT-0083]